jgi:hypothetical protein
MAAEVGLKSGAMLTQLSTGEVWAKHATYGGPYTPETVAALRDTRRRPRGPAEAEPATQLVSATEGRGEDRAVSAKGRGEE